MQILLSPSKTIDISVKRRGLRHNSPVFLKDAAKIADKLKQFSVQEISSIMVTSPKLSQLTYDRYQFWNKDHNTENSCQSILSFKGDVFTGLDAQSLEEEDLIFLNKHLIILSGLYGMLRPLDLIQPYRLEVAHKLDVEGSVNLYDFWSDKVTTAISNHLSGDVLINLASNEYYKMLNLSSISGNVITPVFKEYKNGTYKIVSIYAKRARGLMTRFITKQRIDSPDKLKLFDDEGYYYNDKFSDDNNYVFTRG